MGKLLLVTVCLAFLATIYAKSYDGYKVIQVHPKNEQQYRLIEKFMESNNLDAKKPIHVIGEPVEIIVPPTLLDSTNRHFSRLRMPTEVTIEDVGKVLDEFMEQNSRMAAQAEPGERYDNYQTFDQINEWLDEIAENCGDDCTLSEIGFSTQGRPLKVLSISQGDGSKPNIWVDGGIHAREWISPAVVMYFIEQVVDDLKSGGSLVDRFDWFFLPLINVDGYEYSWTDDRLWRKSRLTWGNTTCVGTDLNRNFDFFWNTIGASDNPCAITFAGFAANTDPETRAVASYVMDNVAEGGLIFLTTHSYSQLWMTPWGYTFDDHENYDAMFEAGTVAVNALAAVYGTEFRVGPASTIIYPSSGTSRDWAAGVPQFPYVYTIELRDTGRYGFELPPDQIRPSVIETWAGFEAMVNFIQPE